MHHCWLVRSSAFLRQGAAQPVAAFRKHSIVGQTHASSWQACQLAPLLHAIARSDPVDGADARARAAGGVWKSRCSGAGWTFVT